MGHWSVRATVEGDGARAIDSESALRRDIADLARDVRDGWTGRCLALTVAYVGVAYAVSALIGLPLHWPVAHMLRQGMLVLLLAYLPLALALIGDGVFGARAHAAGLRAHVVSFRFLGELLLAMTAFQVTLMTFVNLKQYVPAINPRLYDSQLWRLDEWLHFGFAPAPIATELAAGYGLLPFLDGAYLLFFPVQFVVPILFLLAASLRPFRGRFFFAYCLLWMVGGLVYVLWPSLGPCYYRSSRFLWLELAPYAQALQAMLIGDYARFRSDPGYYQVKLYMGVAALPSLHVAVIALFAIATRPWRTLSAALWGLTLVTFAGSVALAWHYAIDGYLGALLAWLCWWVSGRVVGPTIDVRPGAEVAPGSRPAAGLAR